MKLPGGKVHISLDIISVDTLEELKRNISFIKDKIESLHEDNNGYLSVGVNNTVIAVRKNVFISELNQILESQTLPRALYYLRRLVKGFGKQRIGKLNDINLSRWKEYDDILTDSLWVMKKRNTSGAHLGSYWGNFIPQIPNQMMRRYSKQGDWILDPFVGSGTTLIECRRLGRNGVGIELNQDVAESARALVDKEQNPNNNITEIVIGDSAAVDIGTLTNKYGFKQFQLIVAHPPYHDIIEFSQDEADLSKAKSVEDFLSMFGKVVDNITPLLEKNRYFALVIGDKYSKGEWIPLGFYCMNEMMKRGYLLKSTIVKNFDETKGKRNGQELWRFRALVGGFYIFKHEYIFVFQKLV